MFTRIVRVDVKDVHDFYQMEDVYSLPCATSNTEAEKSFKKILDKKLAALEKETGQEPIQLLLLHYMQDDVNRPTGTLLAVFHGKDKH